jgi:hypothetical protein
MGVNEHQEVSLVVESGKPVKMRPDSVGAIVSTFKLSGDGAQLGVTTIRYDTFMVTGMSHPCMVKMKMFLQGPFNDIRSEFTAKAAPRQEDCQKREIVPVNELLSYRVTSNAILI